MRRNIQIPFWAILILVLGPGGVRAAEGGTPLFNAFKSFCADTGARADEVKRAVLAAGGAPHNPPTKSTDTPFSMQSSLWDINAHGQALVVAAGHAETVGADARAMTDCVVSGEEADVASLTALAGWAGVPASAGTNEHLTYYVFEDRGGAHQPVSDGKTAEEAGRIWRLTVIRAPGVVSVELMHLLGRGR